MDLGKLSKLSAHRVCVDCGAEFFSDKELTAMQKHVDHMQIHQPTPEQWTQAYDMTRKAREKAKTA